jgi:putative ABC transport system permease protein
MAMAVVAGVPIGYWLGGIFLENYAYRIDVSPGIIAMSIGLVVTLGLAMVGSQTWRAAAVNPVETLRHE